jgi:hypothetical protein
MGDGELFIMLQPIAKTNSTAAPTKTQIDEKLLREWLPSGLAEEIMRTLSGADGDS